MPISGTLRKGSQTKKLVPRLGSGDIALIDHADLDELAARALVQRQVAAVLNAADTLTGRYPAAGAGVLLGAGIAHIDRIDPGVAAALDDGDAITLRDRQVGQGSGDEGVSGDDRVVLCARDSEFTTGRRWTPDLHRRLERRSRANLEQTTRRFAANTLERALLEMDGLFDDVRLPPLETHLAGRPCLVVVRGPGYREDLKMLHTFVREADPVTVAVDGGADALLEMGWVPDMIVGDMDSVSDEALTQVPERIVHAYRDGHAPGMKRLCRLGLGARRFPVGGTSEDAALLLAHEAGAELIAAVGTHTHAVDFLDKGRQGMASTLLVRLRVGPRLVDAKGVHRLYRSRLRRRRVVELAAAGLIPAGLLVASSPLLTNFFRLLVLNLRVTMGW